MNSDTTDIKQITERKVVAERSVGRCRDDRDHQSNAHSEIDEDKRETVLALETEDETKQEASRRDVEPVSPVMERDGRCNEPTDRKQRPTMKP